MKRSLRISVLLLPVLLLTGPPSAAACQITLPAPGPEDLVRAADVIVRARASGFIPPGSEEPQSVPDGEPIGTVTFEVLETLKGADVPTTIELPGRLTDFDDFNDREAPYDFVRPGGRHGNCWAYQYRHGAEFLLLLAEQEEGEGYRVDWRALAPVNEQLRGPDDPWLWWVKGAVQTIGDALLPRPYSFTRKPGLEVLMVDSEGKPLPGTLLSLCPLGKGAPPTWEVTPRDGCWRKISDRDGKAAFPVEPGRYRLQAALDGFVTTQLAPMVISATEGGRSPDTLVLLLNPVCYHC